MGSCVDTTEIAIEEPPPEEPPAKGGKGAPAEPPPKPPGEPIDLSGVRRPLPETTLPQAEAPPKDAPLFFPLPLADGPAGVEGLLQLRDWLRVGMRIKALYQKKKDPVDPDAAPPAAEEAEGEERQPTPEPIEPRLIGG